jgi:hypothetical protein
MKEQIINGHREEVHHASLKLRFEMVIAGIRAESVLQTLLSE